MFVTINKGGMMINAYVKARNKGVCDKGFIWNPNSCECDCDKSCDAGECLEYENCKGRKKIVHQLVEECTENVEEVKLAEITLVD